MTVSEAAGRPVNFTAPLTVATKTADLYAEIGVPSMAIQFCFSTMPENPMLILVPQDTVLSLANAISEEKVSEVDDNVVAELRPTMEAIVQGMCLSTGQIIGDTLVASSLSIRFNIPSLPTNFQKHDELIRVQVAASAEGVNGNAIWIFDPEVAQFLNGVTKPVESVVFEQAEENVQESTRSAGEDLNGIDRLLDIPLEISVELGRVKMLVKDIVELGTGSIVEIEKAAGEPVDVMVNGRLVARGEVVVIEDNFGVRITEVLSRQDRVNRLAGAA